MARYRKNTFKTVLTMAGILTLGAVFKKQIIQVIEKIPVVGEWVKDMSDKQDAN